MTLQHATHHMIEYPVVKGSLTLLTLAIGAVGAGAVTDAITPDTHLTLGPVLAVGLTVVSAVVYLTKWMQRVDDAVKNLKDEVEKLKNRQMMFPFNNNQQKDNE